MAEVVYTSLADGNGAQGNLFQGRKFWLSHKVPQRSRFIAEIRANGGEVIPSEKQADVLIVDHARKEAFPGTYSYRFIEKSILNGTLERLSDHAVGPPIGTIRAVGSSTLPAKTGRQKFTTEDDRILVNWVRSSLRNGARSQGNEIYKQLQEKNPRHPWQAWRDRWVKYLKDACSTATSDEDRPHSPSDEQEGSDVPEKNDALEGRKAVAGTKFSAKDMEALLEYAECIHEAPSGNLANAWRAWAKDHDGQGRTAQEWQGFWEGVVLPIYLRRAGTDPNSSADSKSKETPLTQKQISRSPSVQSPVFSKINAHQVVKHEPQSPSLRSPIVGETKAHPVISSEPQSPEIPLASGSSSSSLRSLGISKAVEVEEPEPDRSESQERFYPAVETPTDTNLSLKRKRANSEDHYLSSSPPYLEASEKRQKRHESSKPAEIAPTPGQIPAQNQDLLSLAFESRNTQQSNGSRYEMIIDEDGDGHRERWKIEDEDEHLHLNGYGSESSDEDSVQEDEKILGRQASPVLPESSHKANRTQKSLNESTPFIDLDVVPPENGWDESLFLSDSSESSPSPSPLQPSLTYQAPVDLESKNNDIFTVEESQTLLPDLSVPAPDGGWDILESLSSSSSHDSNPPPPASPTQSEIPGLLDAWIDEHVASGFSSGDVISALEHTSLDKELAETVLEHMKRNQGSIPTDMAGVWTESDDEGFQSSNAEHYRDVEQKHGSENLEKRWNFLMEFMECKRSAEGEGGG